MQATDADGDPLAYDLPTAPAGMTIDAGGVIRWTPAASQFGPNDVTVRVQDGRGGVATQAFTVNVTAQPSEPAAQHHVNAAARRDPWPRIRLRRDRSRCRRQRPGLEP